MAISVSQWVWERSESAHGSRLVLLAIADAIREERIEDGAWPSVAWLMRRTRLKERAVHTAIADLEKLGELRVARNGGPKGCNLYHVVLPCTPAKSAPLQNQHPAESAPPQNPQADESSQADGQMAADSAPPAESAGVQNSTPTPAESAPETVREPENSPTESSTYTDAREGDALFDAPKPQRGKRKAASRPIASRIPDDFAIDAPMRDWARAKVPGYDIDSETETFIDYWRGRGDARAMKADWVATWRNWMRDNAKKVTASPVPASTNGHRRGGYQPYANPADDSVYDARY